MKDSSGMVRPIIIVCLTCLLNALQAEDLPKAISPSPAIQNVFQASTNVYSGSQPEGEAGFAALEQLGIKTILSVDGAIPDVQTAKQYGMRYIHLPIGYDGIPTNRAVELAEVAKVVEGPIYVHCHHGKHRGPAAAATVCMAEGIWTPAQAIQWLHQAGTSTHYQGLYRSVSTFPPHDLPVFSSEHIVLPEITQPTSLVEAMVAIDTHHDRLKAIQKAGWATLPNHPDVTPTQESLLMWEQFRELIRQNTGQSQTAGFQTELVNAAETLGKLHEHLTGSSPPPQTARLDALFKQVSQDCARCHRKSRN